MSFVLFKDSFDAWKVAAFSDTDLFNNFFSRYTNGGLNGFASINNTGRTGQCIDVGRGSGGFFKTLEHAARWVVGFAYRINGAGAGGVDAFYEIMNNGTPLFSLRQAFDGTLVMFAGSTPIDVTERALLKGRWYFIEVDVTFSGSTVSTNAELRINGHVEASGSGSTGQAASGLLSQTADANVHSFSGLQAVGGGCSFDDLYIKNTAGYEGDVRDITIYPDGDGGTLDWTPNAGSDHFSRVNTHPVDLTKFLSTATPGDIDLWTFTLPSFSGVIKGINIRVLAQKTDEGTKSFKIVFGATGTDGTSAEFFVSDVTPEYYEYSLTVDPGSGLAFVPGDVITAGVKLIS